MLPPVCVTLPYGIYGTSKQHQPACVTKFSQPSPHTRCRPSALATASVASLVACLLEKIHYFVVDSWDVSQHDPVADVLQLWAAVVCRRAPPCKLRHVNAVCILTGRGVSGNARSPASIKSELEGTGTTLQRWSSSRRCSCIRTLPCKIRRMYTAWILQGGVSIFTRPSLYNTSYMQCVSFTGRGVSVVIPIARRGT